LERGGGRRERFKIDAAQPSARALFTGRISVL